MTIVWSKYDAMAKPDAVGLRDYLRHRLRREFPVVIP